MSWFDKKQEDQGVTYDPERHEVIEVRGRDDHGETCHEYVRDKATQRIIGQPNWAYRVQPLEKKGRTP